MGSKDKNSAPLAKLIGTVLLVGLVWLLFADVLLPYLGGLLGFESPLIVFDLFGWMTPLVLALLVIAIPVSMGFGWRAGTSYLVVCLAAWFWQHDGVDRGLDLKGGASLTYSLDMTEIPFANREDTLRNTVRVIEERINNLGLKDLKVDALPPNQFEVQFPGKETSEVERIKSILTLLGQLEFRMIALPPDWKTGNAGMEETEFKRKEEMGESYHTPLGFRWVEPRIVRNAQGDVIPAGGERLVEIPEAHIEAEIERLKTRKLEPEVASDSVKMAELGRQILELEKDLASAIKKDYFTGADLDPSGLMIRQGQFGTSWVVAFALRPTRKEDFTQFTTKNIKRQMGIIIDGRIESAPVIQTTLPGGGQISGGGIRGFSRDEAQDLVTVLRSGSLDAEITLQSEFAIGPSLGEAAIRRGMLATVLGLSAVVLFMVGTYLFPGLVAVFALAMNLLIIMGALAFAGAQLSLPGIAGVILTVGMAVDANILVFERIREERSLGKSLAQAVKAGYERAFITIVDANVTTLFVAVVLIWFTTGQVKGFAITLICGILASLFTALFVTRSIFTWLIERNLVTDLRMPHLFGVPRLSYMKIRAPVTLLSLTLMVAGVIGFASTGTDKYDIDFSGGQRVVLAFEKPVAIDIVKKQVHSQYRDATVVSIKSGSPDAQALNLAIESDSFQITIGAANTEEIRAEVLAFLSDSFESVLAPQGIIALARAADATKQPFQLNFNREVTKSEVAALLGATRGVKKADILSVDGNSVQVEIALDQSEDVFREELAHELGSSDLALSEPFPAQSFVDPTTAEKHKDDAMAAVLVSLIFQIIYIYFRFHGAAFGFAAVLALVHDVLITLGAIAFFGSTGLVNVKISLPIIAAILTVIGYSMNDSIVVFDRIRENLGKGKKNLSEVIDLSVNQTMSRSLRTSITTFLVVLILFVVNYGAASSILEGFAFVLMIGVITGTYSSIFVASPMLLFLPWHYLRGRKGIFWLALGTTLIGMVALLFSDLAPTWFFWAAIGAISTYPVYFLIDLVIWLFLPDPDRALNRILRSNGAKY